jgi:uncharacterized membrane protein YtjA (UPF0391 family)
MPGRAGTLLAFEVARSKSLLRRTFMLRAAIIFFVIAIVAMLFGMNNIAGISAEVGKTLLYVFLALAVISFVISLFSGRRSGPPM